MSTLAHFAASLGTPAASFGALAAMVHVGRVFLAFYCAGVANVSAELA